MAEYIKRESAIDAVLDVFYDTTDIDLSGEKLEAAILNVQAADVEPVKRGRWIMGTGENGLQTGHRKCSRCGEIVKYGYSLYGVHNFCNYCGAKMIEEVNT